MCGLWWFCLRQWQFPNRKYLMFVPYKAVCSQIKKLQPNFSMSRRYPWWTIFIIIAVLLWKKSLCIRYYVCINLSCVQLISKTFIVGKQFLPCPHFFLKTSLTFAYPPFPFSKFYAPPLPSHSHYLHPHYFFCCLVLLAE